jgi:hypothetical protein
VQCANGHTHAGPYDGHSFYSDFVRELTRRTQRESPPPYFPHPEWFAALRYADERDRVRCASAINANGDADYFERQHIYSPPTYDDFNLRNREPIKIPKVDLCPAGLVDRRGTWQTKRKAERERAATANGNGVTGAATP